ncbi:FG-GAP repeat domain-containing protein [Cellulomonas persica]
MRTSGRTTARLTAASAALVALVLTQTPGAATAASSPEPERRRIGSSVLLATAEPRKHAKPTKRAAVTVSDFDGDGVDDLAVAGSGPGWTHDGHVVDGAVAVRYSSLQRRDVFAGITEATRSGCAGSFASALATGDFDRDGYDDLAVGSTCESPERELREEELRRRLRLPRITHRADAHDGTTAEPVDCRGARQGDPGRAVR